MKMKKLMVGAFAVVLATVTQAASVSWTCTNVQNSKGTVSGVAYVFFVSGATRTSHSAVDTLMATIAGLEGNGATAVANGLSSANYSYENTTAGNFGHAAVDQVTDLGISSAETKNYGAFAVIFDTDEITDKSNFYVTTAAYAQLYDDSSTSTKAFAIGNQSASATSGWHAVAVPEPTSGLMLLLGMAGLALRRRRA